MEKPIDMDDLGVLSTHVINLYNVDSVSSCLFYIEPILKSGSSRVIRTYNVPTWGTHTGMPWADLQLSTPDK